MTGRLISACSRQHIRAFEREINRHDKAARDSSSDDDDSDSSLAHSLEMGHTSATCGRGRLSLAGCTMRKAESCRLYELAPTPRLFVRPITAILGKVPMLCAGDYSIQHARVRADVLSRGEV
jgi:hypothetical protein